MSIHPGQLRTLIEQVLAEAPVQQLNMPAAVDLLMLTAATESRLGTFIRQVNGPAEGVFQMEPATERDIWLNYLSHPSRSALKWWVVSYTNTGEPYTKIGVRDLVFNLAYQIAMARIHYWRKPGGLPRPEHPNYELGLAAYWKTHYNTHLGKGTIEKALADYRRLVKGA
jgi:hypothetical protein